MLSRPEFRIGLIGAGFMGKAIEVARFVQAIDSGGPEPFGFRAGLRIQSLVEAIHRSSANMVWKAIEAPLRSA